MDWAHPLLAEACLILQTPDADRDTGEHVINESGIARLFRIVADVNALFNRPEIKALLVDDEQAVA